MKHYTLITGATSGIGYELTMLFGKDNHNLILVGRDKERLKKIQQRLNEDFNIDVIILKKDLTFEDDVEEIISFVEKNNLIVDNLINNAGVGSFGYFHEVDSKKDLDMIKVNIYALTRLTKYFLQKMIDRNNGGILNVASTAAFQPGPIMSVYYATKAYVLSLTEAIQEEVREKGIKVTALCPGPVATEFQRRANVKKSELTKGYMMDAKIVARIGYKGFMNGKTLIIPGFKNKILIQSLRVLPRKFVRKIIKRVNNG
ncbi:short-chain dehydrogenase [Clostridium polyendosporum]|uniref:Short-chain dehydrogenase n=1 Tax=Clostridium polyendosporum TaxID=69208 RepID=A0A919VG75_9CLOT|nr:SDR family oxidoreductase [Clostridium polyendosporum]GIM28907.1 short-chain dehydrogenase [Clostridium polyendosporum]